MRFRIGILLLVFSLIFSCPIPSQAQESFNDPELKLVCNGQEIELNSYPYINHLNRTMIAAADCTELFGAQVELADNNQVVIIKNDLQISFRVGENEIIVGHEILPADCPPEKIGEAIQLPLRSIAGLMGYTVNYHPLFRAVSLTSSAYQGPQIPVTWKPLSPEPIPIPDNLPLWGTLDSAPALGTAWSDEELIGAYYTTLINSPPGRTTNIVLSCHRINGQIVPAGKIFSFNQTVGKRTPASGYQEAPIFVGRKVIPGIGGGICQTSSTLYNCALESGMEIVERYTHTLKVAYVPYDRDATVSWDGADMKFRNSRDYPIKIQAQVIGKYVVCAFTRVP
ncbi:VanW family protein [Syntrophomonas erecta]